LIDVQAAVKKKRLNYLNTHQSDLRIKNYHNLQERLGQDTANPTAINKVAILSFSFFSGDRAIQQLFQDSICLITHFGKPDFFITFTVNPR
jgi:hypothetical protein